MKKTLTRLIIFLSIVVGTMQPIVAMQSKATLRFTGTTAADHYQADQTHVTNNLERYFNHNLENIILQQEQLLKEAAQYPALFYTHLIVQKLIEFSSSSNLSITCSFVTLIQNILSLSLAIAHNRYTQEGKQLSISATIHKSKNLCSEMIFWTQYPSDLKNKVLNEASSIEEKQLLLVYEQLNKTPYHKLINNGVNLAFRFILIKHGNTNLPTNQLTYAELIKINDLAKKISAIAHEEALLASIDKRIPPVTTLFNNLIIILKLAAEKNITFALGILETICADQNLVEDDGHFSLKYVTHVSK